MTQIPTTFEILAEAMRLLGRHVIVRWSDDDGGACGVDGTLKRIDPPHTSPTGRKVGRAITIENAYGYIELDRVSSIEDKSPESADSD